MPAISVDQITKNFGHTKALDSVCLQIEEGEIFGFIGPNGAGKSTLIKILLNFIFPTSGQAQILGLNVTKESAALKKFVSYVPSEVRFYENMHAHEIFSYVESFHGITATEKIQYLSEMLQVNHDKKFYQLSLGNKKKIALVAALLWQPKLIILDEPTSGLDPLIQKRLFEVLKEHQIHGGTVFLSSHTLSEIEEYCTRVGFIKNGKIIASKSLNDHQAKTKILTIWGQYPSERLISVGAKCLSQDHKKTIFSYDGSLDKITYALAENPPIDYTLTNLSLEDEFLSYYQGGAQQ